MRETVVNFGPQGILCGVLTEPDRPNIGLPAVVMSNVAVNHHVGPSRMWVELARRMARHGFTSLRFDLSGLGDSLSRDLERGSDIDRSVRDLRDALTCLSSRGFERFALVSLCSGTDSAHVVTTTDPRVHGAAFLDGYTYPTPRSYLHRIILNKLSPAHWRRWLRRRILPAIDSQFRRQLANITTEIYTRQYPERAQFETDIETVVDRGAHVLFFYSGEVDYLYERQLFDWMRRKQWGARLSLCFQQRANHTYTFLEDREPMFAKLEDWLVSISRDLPSTDDRHGAAPIP